MKKWLKWLLISVAILIALIAIALFQPWAFLPHGYAEISLPFASEDDQFTDMIPMGEVEQWHNASTGLPDGHPGIDFQWNKETDILAIGDGLILSVSKNHEGKYNVQQFVGAYFRTVYQEMNTVEPNIKSFSRVKKGQKLGTSGWYRKSFDGAPKPSDPSPQIHWDFSGSSITTFRLCPLNHFDAESKKRVEAIWERMKEKGQYKKEYPLICNGAYAGKDK